MSKKYTLAELKAMEFNKLYKFLYEFDISDSAIILYTIMRDRWQLSVDNGWVNKNGEIYFYFRRKDIQKIRPKWDLRSISRYIKELVDNGLLTAELSTSGQDTKYYFTKINDELLSKDRPLDKNDYTPSEFVKGGGEFVKAIREITINQTKEPERHRTFTRSREKNQTDGEIDLLEANDIILLGESKTHSDYIALDERGATYQSQTTQTKQEPKTNGEVAVAEVVAEIEPELNADSFMLKSQFAYENTTKDYKAKLKRYIENLRQDRPHYQSFEEFENALLAKGYKYKNFARAYIQWQRNQKPLATKGVNEKGEAVGAMGIPLTQMCENAQITRRNAESLREKLKAKGMI